MPDDALPGNCPLLAANFVSLARASGAAHHAQDVQYVQLTIDPERDTPARLAAYRQLFRPAPGNWSTLTGPPSSIAAIWKYFGADYRKVAESSPPARDWWTAGRRRTTSSTPTSSHFSVRTSTSASC